MEQARHYVCRRCGAHLPTGNKFCGACGTSVPEARQRIEVQTIADLDGWIDARLVMVRGIEADQGRVFSLTPAPQTLGRTGCDVAFSSDPWVADKHAQLSLEGAKLIIKDLSRGNGIYVKLQKPQTITFGDTFLCGEAVLTLEPPPNSDVAPSLDNTTFYTSPFAKAAVRIVQIMEGGHHGLEYCAQGGRITLGREGCDLNFPDDIFMSANHASLEQQTSETFVLSDSDSRNGTYVRIKDEIALEAGEAFFVGHQLLRFDLTTPG